MATLTSRASKLILMRRCPCFDLRRGGTLLTQIALYEPLLSGITSNPQFIEMKALKNVNASIAEYAHYVHGEFDKSLLQLLVSFYLAESAYNTHIEDSIKIQMENRRRIAADKAKAKK